MHVHVHRLWGHLHMQHAGRELARHNGPLIGLLQGRHGRPAADKAPVNKEILHTAVGAAPGRGADKALHLYMPQLIIHWYQRRGKLPAADGIHRRGQLAVPGAVQLLPAVADEADGYLRVGHGQLVQNARYGIALCHVLFQEFHPRRGVEKQVPYHYSRPLWAASFRKHGLLLPAAGIAHANRLPHSPGKELHMGHRRDRGQSLPPEAQSANGVQILLPTHFARGMAQESHRHILRRNAAAVIRDPHICDAAPAYLHGDDSGPRVHGVLHQLLYHRRGPLHHLAGGDKLGHLFIQHANFRHFLAPSFFKTFAQNYLQGLPSPQNNRRKICSKARHTPHGTRASCHRG